MPDFPPEVIQRAAEVRYRQYDSEFNASHLSWQDFAGEAREILDAVAEQLGQVCASKILAHMEAGGPQPARGAGARSRYGAWRRHFNAAARVAARAFLTDDDMRRIAARELAAGNFAACPVPGEQR